jgi:sigma-B regulation protein RsbU (phosphoserine phosphatase)
MNIPKTDDKKSVREILLMGVFWRILIIEGILLVYSLGYRWLAEGATSLELFWYSVRITVFVAIIIVFMMVTLKKFLTQKIILPLEAITSANKAIQQDITGDDHLVLSENSSHEINNIVTTRSQMLKTILDVSEERLTYSRALDEELEKGKKIQKDFLPDHLPKADNCDIAVFFKSALQLSGDFYDVFELPDGHIGFVVGDVSDKGVGAALFMALTRSLLRVFSGYFNNSSRYECTLSGASETWQAENALHCVSLTNEYLAKEHGDDGMFVTLLFGIFDPESGLLFYVNAGHEPLFLLDTDGPKQSLSTTGPALGVISGASYDIKSIRLEKGDMLFCYTDGVTEAQSETGAFYTRARLEKLIRKGSEDASDAFLTTIRSDLFAFMNNAEQSDDITMLALKWF